VLRLVLAAWILAAVARADQAVEVRVVDASTGAGIPDIALKFLQSGQNLYSGATDTNGRFRVEAAKEGSYTILYDSGKFWPAHDPPTVTFQVAGGADPVRLEIEMYQSGKISGRVLDAAGKPVPNASLGLLEITPASGMGLLFKADETGEYSAVARRPGPWVLTATPPPSWPPPDPDSPGAQPLGWTETFYPGVTSFELAAQIVVPPGGELRNLDIKLAAVPVRRIRGVVLDVSGNPVSKVSVTVDGKARPSLHQDSRSDGTFDFPSVVDGECRLSTMADRDGAKLRAVQWVQAKGHDLENVELRLTSRFSIQGKIVMEAPGGAPAPKPPGIAVRSADMFSGFDSHLTGIGFFYGNTDGKGGFTIDNLYPGSYQILPAPPPQPYYLDSIRFGARDAAGSNVEILPGDLPPAPYRRSTELTVTYKLNGGTVRGTAEGCATGQVVLIPQDPALRRDGFIRRTGCGQNGRFEITAVRPGEYYGLAVVAPAGPRLSDFSAGPPLAAGLEQNLINQSIRITVRSNEATLADLHPIAQ
jgi:hypothetical protein